VSYIIVGHLQQRQGSHRQRSNNMNVLSGKAYWTSISSPNTTFEPVWCVDLSLTGDQLSKAKAMGLPIKNKGDDRGDFVKIKRNVKRNNGAENKQPALKDAQKRDMLGTQVGNGSDVNVAFKTYNWEYAGNKGVGTDLMAVQVINLVPYGGSEEDAFDVVPDGFVSEDGDDAFASLDDDIPFGTVSVAS
jgi:hypothetical protein